MPQQAILRRPEIMSPAGHWPQLRAAIEAGADAVYFGLKHFSARAKVGFGLDELPDALETLHKRGVRGYITFNTLAFEHELEEAARTIAALAEAGADALIVQDVGILRLAREIAPDIELHASTQMSITDAEGVRFAQSLGVQRVTLARELSLREVAAIIEQTGCDVEIFVHGALCVAYSGQCFSSEAWGGRSANRGQCAQACRLPYQMIVDGESRSLGDARYLLSPGDLFALEQVPEIVRCGVAALKIEGRYKDAEYVALTTAAYRKAVDAACAGQPLEVTPGTRLELEQVYSRGLGPFFLTGTNHQAVVGGRAPRHRGVLVGTVISAANGSLVIEPSEAEALAPLKPGDGLVFDAAHWRSPEEPEEGGRVYEALRDTRGRITLRFANAALDLSRIRPGDLVWRTHDPQTEKAAAVYTRASAPVSRQRVDVHVTAVEGHPLEITWQLENNPAVRVHLHCAEPLAPATRHETSGRLIGEQLSRLGNTAYEMGRFEATIEGNPFVPVSLLNQLRRQAVSELEQQQAKQKPVSVHSPSAALNKMRPSPSSPAASPLSPQLHVLVRTAEQLEAAFALHPASLTLDYLDLYGLRPSVEKVKAAGIPVRVASPRLLKPGESRIANFLSSLQCPILVRSTGLLSTLRAGQHAHLIGDFSLNAANALSARTLLDSGLSRITPTHDLNAQQIADLAAALSPGEIEVVAYQHLPVFHTEHCVFCRFLTTGTSYLDCGRPCEKHQVALRDTQGRNHPVIADVGCRNTVFGAEAQTAGAFLDAWLKAGIAHLRLEFVHESGEQLLQVYHAFHSHLSGQLSARSLETLLRRIAPGGATDGSLFVPAKTSLLPVLQ